MKVVPIFRGMALIAVALFVLSCAGRAPESSKGKLDVGLPDDYQTKYRKGRALADVNWIATFADSRLSALVKEGQQNNRELQVAAANMEIAGARAGQAGSDLFPQINGRGRGQRAAQNFVGFPVGPGGSTPVLQSLTNQFDLAIDLSWELDLWGRIRAGQSAALAELQASQTDRAAAKLSLSGQIAKLWFALIETRQQQDLAKRTVGIFAKTEKILRDKFELGMADEQKGLASQLRLAMSDQATAREQLTRQKQQVEQVSRQLEVLLGRYPAAALSSGMRLPSMPPSPPAGLPASLLDRRPDLVAAERRLAATDKRLLEAKLAMFPTIALTGSGGRTSNALQSLSDGNLSVWSIAGGVAQPVFQGGKIREGINIRKAEAKRALADYEKQALVAFREVEDALAGEAYLRERERDLKSAAKLAADAYKSSDEEYANGVGDVLTMLTAQRQMVLKESERLIIRRLRLDNRVDLHLTLGGDFKERQKHLGKEE
ncbi:MAG: efflux transporter outer membrane subunit [Verrucomicrobiales bacterium]|nr:efflux transporter outer membrane subunit [Verrucomicrobiales bacterium]